MIARVFAFSRLQKAAYVALAFIAFDGKGTWAQHDPFEVAQTLLAQQKYHEAIEYLNNMRVEGDDAAQQYILLADALLQTGAGIASETAIERARRLGASYAITVVPYAKSLLIQGKYTDSLNSLRGVSIPEDMQLAAFIISGDANFSLQKYDVAQRDYEAAQALDDSDFQAYLGLARLQLRYGSLDKAKEFAQAAEARAAGNTMVHYTMGLISRYLGALDDAERYFVEAVRLYAGNVMANLELASLRINQGRINEAEQYLDTVYKSSPGQPMGLYLSAVILASRGEYGDAALLLNRARPLSDRYLPAVYVRGLVAYQLNNLSVALEALEKVVAVRPGNVTARLALASTYNKQGRPLTALEMLAPMLEAKTVDVHTLTIAAAAAINAGDAAQGEEYYRKAAALNDTGASGGIAGLDTRLALAQYAVGETEKALATLTTVTAGSAVEIRELSLMGSMQIRTKDYSGAAKTIDRIIKVNPRLALGYNMRGTLFFKLGDFQSAVASYSQALETNPQFYDAHRNRGLAYMRVGENARAENDLKTLLEQQPDDTLAKAALAKSLLNQGKAEEAVDFFREAFREIPTSFELAADYAQALADAGVTTRAIQQARATTILGADNPDLLKRMGLLLLDLDQARAAERPLSRHAAFKPDSGEAHLLHGRALLQMGLYTGSAISFTRATRAQDDIPDKAILDWYFFAAEALGQKYNAALGRLRTLDTNRRPKDISASIFGDLLLASGEPVKAEQSYREIMQTEKTSRVMVGLAKALTAQSREEEAITEMFEYLVSSPDDRLVREALGVRLEQSGRFEEAGKQYEKILRIGVADAKIAARLASIYQRPVS
ncbi:MAG: PEP-CTERM system TPR-repeat protein PrsT, partial [Kordiimonadaceae bacterium]|nr:PEP-CTERM system TPR-repeat protein PrsT [Kordiimonadaceae bacterium]